METSRAPRGAFYISVQYALNFAFGMIFYMIAARMLPKEDIGAISVLTFLYIAIPVVTQLALPAAATKYISEFLGRGKAEKGAAVASMVKKTVLVLSLITLAIMLALSNWFSTLLWGGTLGATIFIFISFVIFISTIRLTFWSFLQGLQWFGKFAVAGFVAFALTRILSAIFVVLGLRLMGVATGWLIGEAAGLILVMAFLRGAFTKPKDKIGLKMLFRFSLPLFAMLLVVTISDWVDRMLFLGLSHDLASLGIYDLAVRGATTISIVWSSFSMTVFPMLSELYGRKGKKTVTPALKTSLRYLTFLILPACLGLAAISKTAMATLFGHVYTIGSLPLAILGLASVLIAFGMVFGSAIQALGETRVFIGIGAASILADAIVIFLAVPIFGVLGATMARVVLWAVYATTTLLALKRHIKVEFDMEALWKGTLASIIMVLPLLFLEVTYADRFPESLTLLFAGTEIFVGIVVYGVSLIILRALHSRDFKLLKQIAPASFHRFLDPFKRFFVH